MTTDVLRDLPPTLRETGQTTEIPATGATLAIVFTSLENVLLLTKHVHGATENIILQFVVKLAFLRINPRVDTNGIDTDVLVFRDATLGRQNILFVLSM